MREQFQQELAYLQGQLTKMFEQVNLSLKDTLTAFATQDSLRAQAIIEHDHVVNQREQDIEMDCARLIALQQPVVADLRLVISIMQVCSDLERMGDHVVSVAKSSIKVTKHQQVPSIEEKILSLGQKVLSVSRETLAIYQEMNVTLAKQIGLSIEEIEVMRKEIVEDCRLAMKDDAKNVFNGAEYISVLMHMKRIADYATNICERVVYIQTGQIIELG